MEEDLMTPEQVQPAASVEGRVSAAPTAKPRKKTRDFFLGFAASFLGSIIFSLIGLLLITKINPDYDFILTALVFGWPLIFLGITIFLLISFFKRNRDIFWGILAGFLGFLILLVLILKFA